ncbi:DUF5615 family PIN-like protein [Aurantimonas sp. A2-1-M11]|uniref:DUF5615 family PIN-like protein n=1 Tax=Aurantimonas sp. A2-1-M11 TaxID=3113712 RepID=UPI002F957E08
MKPKRTPIPFFTDNDVPDGVGVALQEYSHTVVRLRDRMLRDSPDPVVAAACREQGLVLFTHNVKHFRSISQKYESKERQTDRLCRVLLECRQFNSPARIVEAIGLIEAEWDRLGDQKHGLHITLGDRWIRIHR